MARIPQSRVEDEVRWFGGAPFGAALGVALADVAAWSRSPSHGDGACLVYALGPAGELAFVYGDYTDGGPDWDFDVDASMVEDSFARWVSEQCAADDLLGKYSSLDEISTGNRRSVRWNVQKLVGEYARHNGHADLLRERIDGATGES